MSESLFEKMVTSLSDKEGVSYLDICMSPNTREIKKVPLRYRLIAFGFARGMTLNEINQLLRQNGLDQLYARNMLEASLIFAFSNRMSYGEWNRLQKGCQSLLEKASDQRYFLNKSVSLIDVRNYVRSESKADTKGMHTANLTQALYGKISRLPRNDEMFYLFMEENAFMFSSIREKARYYFCRYMLAYIDSRIDQYLESLSSGTGKDYAISELIVLKNISQLKRRKMNAYEAESLLRFSDISFGNLYDAFNYYYFEYVSNDWMDVLIDYYGGNLSQLPPGDKKELARAIRLYNPKWAALSDDRVLREKQKDMERQEREMDRIFSLSNPGAGYQRNRAGENSLRKYVKGSLDIDRITLLCYLLFFTQSSGKRTRITLQRMNQILHSCGFMTLQSDQDFDYFILRYMHAEDPVDVLMQSVTSYALNNKNFYLYHMYRESVKNDEQFRGIL